MAFDFDSIFEMLNGQLLDFAKNSFQDYIKQAIDSGQSILNDFKDDIKNWGVQLANGEISANDLHDLVEAKMDSIKIAGLTQQGLLEIQAEKLKNGMLNLLVHTLTSAI